MQLGFAVPVSGSWATPANQVEVARRAEELGYASVWTFQRLLFPVAAEGKRWQPVYRSVADPIVTLAFLAGQTTRVRLGVAVVNMPWFSPILLAKQSASLDIVSGGRLEFGTGRSATWTELAGFQADPDTTKKTWDEIVRCLPPE